ncbi:uncharacterized protein LOC111444986 [Cucurbita moschata]|uniref:Uncharacterized protein LOC111444986 n=1 Tax=Cucurbita moschata TaxID=3662 RepID=A0A6J1FK93_CUCMO|nr:uncharacterized protein LOC111444986 [Cucurbita moschata]
MMNEKIESVVMSSENGFQDSQVLASSNIRRKVDGLHGRENGDSKEQVLPDSKCNGRMSLAWDSAFFTSPGVLEPEELFTTLNSRNYDNVVDILGSEEHLLLSSQSLEPDTNNENYNFRKSLAWDNGFFTSEGVLNPFELAIVNNGLKKSEGHLLPVIEDDVWRSMESNSTLDSEGSSLTRLEMDLFEDIRASITKLNASRFEQGRTASAKPDGSRTMMKDVPTCRRHSVHKHASKKIIGQMPKSPKIQLKHMGESREHYSSSSLKPFKASEKTSFVSRSSTKIASWGEKHVKLGCRSGVSASVEGFGKLKKPCLRDSFSAIHGSTQSLRSSLPHFTTSKKLTRRPPSEVTIRKSPPVLRRKTNFRTSNIFTTGSASTTPLMKTRASKTEVESSCQSTPTSSWYGSPASSIEEWPLETTSTARRCTNRSKRSPYSSLIKSPLMDKENRHETSVNRRHRKDLKEDGNTDASRILREVKPSGLRMPSPKLGFFDRETMLRLATIVDAKQDVHTRCTELPSPRTRPRAEIRNDKYGGSPVCVASTKGNRSPTVASYNRIVQCNQSMKAKKIISRYAELDDKENEVSFVDPQIEGLAMQVNSIRLNNRVN